MIPTPPPNRHAPGARADKRIAPLAEAKPGPPLKPDHKGKKKAKGAKKGGTKLKGMRLRPKTGEGDLATKTKRAREFLEEGDKVQFTVIFRGRELARQDLGTTLLERVAEMLEDVAKIEKAPAMEGRRMHMTLVRK